MKKAYVKPDIMFESFTLSMNIATGCEHVANHTKGACTYEVEWLGEDVTIFDGGVTGGCDVWVQDEEFNGICYHMSAANNIFTS